ncbi:sigma-70 family RNA polymerase sigma factor [Lentibacillus halophilus]|uniref:sigma-70 family RNA polymerase sigma factor n=1 Tax=Lentibacillus halophilus TaxID=295065 RepID=UPI003CD09396
MTERSNPVLSTPLPKSKIKNFTFKIGFSTTISLPFRPCQLYQAIQTLTPKQKGILTHKYVHGVQNNEIAALFNDSPQNVFKLHRKALKRLKNHLKKEQDSHDNS